MRESPTATNILDREVSGRVARPGDNDWDAMRQAFNLAVDQRPDLVAVPADANDVARVVEFAAEREMRVAPQRTGHTASLGSLEGTILLKTSAMTGVEIDADARRARVLAGAQWQDLVPDASDLGLAALHGSAPDIGIVGYTLGGGIGWYARKLGLASNSVTAIELVTADGRLVRADADNHPDLYWALRGSGGNFGVVTAMELSLYPVDQLYAGALFFPFERSAEVLHAWREWVESVPDEVTSVGRMLQFPPIPEIPEPMRGQSFAVVEAVYMGGEDEGAELLAPLRELGPATDTFAMVPPSALPELHMDPPEPVPFAGGDGMQRDLSARAIGDLVEVVGPGSGSPLLSVELRHLGGALARPEAAHGALPAVDGRFLSYAVGMVVDAESRAAVEGAIARVGEALASSAAERRYYNFVDEEVDPSTFYEPEALERLRRLKAELDPNGMFLANHELTANR